MIQSKIVHQNFNVRDLKESLKFYDKALGLRELRRIKTPDGAYAMSYLGDGLSEFELQLTWACKHPHPYDLGENAIHLAFEVSDLDSARKLHREMGCIYMEPSDMPSYFIRDPDGYVLEIIG